MGSLGAWRRTPCGCPAVASRIGFHRGIPGAAGERRKRTPGTCSGLRQGSASPIGGEGARSGATSQPRGARGSIGRSMARSVARSVLIRDTPYRRALGNNYHRNSLLKMPRAPRGSNTFKRHEDSRGPTLKMHTGSNSTAFTCIRLAEGTTSCASVQGVQSQRRRTETTGSSTLISRRANLN